MQANAQISDTGSMDASRAPSFVLALFVGVGAVGILLAEQVLTGWLALGERANISRRHINTVEWLAVLLGVVIAAIALRTAWGLYQRERAGWAWARWVSFATGIGGLALAYGSVLPSIIKSITNSSNVYPLASNQLIFQVGLGLILLVAGWRIYRYVSRGVEGLTPDKYLRVQLSKSPSAGALIGYIAIFFSFAIATPLFLQPTSIASYMTNAFTGLSPSGSRCL
jgi:hypothetical protein